MVFLYRSAAFHAPGDVRVVAATAADIATSVEMLIAAVVLHASAIPATPAMRGTAPAAPAPYTVSTPDAVPPAPVVRTVTIASHQKVSIAPLVVDSPVNVAVMLAAPSRKVTSAFRAVAVAPRVKVKVAATRYDEPATSVLAGIEYAVLRVRLVVALVTVVAKVAPAPSTAF